MLWSQGEAFWCLCLAPISAAPLPSSAAKGSSAPAVGVSRAQNGTNQGHKGPAGRSQAGDEPRNLWQAWCLDLQLQRLSVTRNVMAKTWWVGRWSELSQVSSQTPATPDQPLSEFMNKKIPSFPLHMYLQGRRKPNLCTVGLHLRSAALDLSWMTKKGQAGCPSLYIAKMRRQWTWTLFCFCSLCLTQAFIFRDLS